MITRINHTPKGVTYSTLELDELVAMLRSETYLAEISAYRNEMNIRIVTNDMPYGEMHPNGVPDICFAAQWRKMNGRQEMKQYNALVMLEIGNLPDTDAAIQLRKEASRIPYTRLAFVGATGRDVVVVCALKTEDMERMGEERLKVLHLSAYKRLHYLYSSQLLVSLDNKNPLLDRSCPVSVDADAYYNPDSEALYVSEVDIEVPVFRGVNNNVEPVFRDADVVSLHTIFEWCMSAAWEKAREYAGKHGIADEYEIADYALHKLAENCCEASVPIDFGVRRASWNRHFSSDLHYINKVFDNAYEQKTAKLVPYGIVNKNALLAYKIDAYLKMHYELRRNVLTGVVQYRNKDGYHYDFMDLTEAVLNTMATRAMKAGIGSWDKDVRRIINSDEIPEYDPIEAYIFSRPKWDGKDRIADFVKRIPTDTPDVHLYLRTWLLSMVAHWLGRDVRHGNALVPLLIGHQGCGKSTLCGMILPPELYDYYNDKVNFKNETDLNLGLSSFALINIDEFDSVKKSQQPVLKYLLSKSNVKMRPPFGKAYESRRRFASFIATTNKSRPLVDKTGSRRFACIHVIPGKSIDTITPIDYDQLYAQLSYEVFNGARYWLNDEETQLLMAHNDMYRELSDIAEMVSIVFTPAADEQEGQYYTTYELLDILEERFPDLVRTSNINAELGKILRARHYLSRKRNSGITYLVKIQKA